MPKITISHASGTENKYGLEGKIFTIGRAPDNDITLPDGSSSNYHAVLKLSESGDFSVSDLGSTNHTRVNGKRISTRELRDGDHILFGDTLAIYESEFAHNPAPQDATANDDQPATEAQGARPAPIKAPKRQPKAPATSPGTEPPAAQPLNNSGGCLGLILVAATIAALTLIAGVAYSASTY